jgi:hypothetical protein
MAYAKTPEQIDSIFRAKQKQFNRSTSTHTQREPTRTSLENIIKPLKQLKDDMEHESLKNLFTAVLAINEDQIDVSFALNLTFKIVFLKYQNEVFQNFLQLVFLIIHLPLILGRIVY